MSRLPEVFLLVSCLAQAGCTRSNPAYCSGPQDCPDPILPFCDPIIHTCVSNGTFDAGREDGAGGDGNDMNEDINPGDDRGDEEPAVIWVDDCAGEGSGTQADPYCSLQQAYEAAPDGGRLTLLPGVYTVNLIIRKDVTIAGEAGAIIESDNCPVISVLGGARVSLDGLLVRGGAGLVGLLQASGESIIMAKGLTLGPSGCIGLKCVQSQCRLHSSLVLGNKGGGLELGQAVYDIQSCVLAANGGLGTIGGARLTSPRGSCRFAFNTVAGNQNQGGVGTGGVECVNPADLDSCILWGNEGDQASMFCNVSYSNSEQVLGGTNQSQDPLFVNAAGLDFHLGAGSPSINAGNPNASDIPPDPDGRPRPQPAGGRADQGAYEKP